MKNKHQLFLKILGPLALLATISCGGGAADEPLIPEHDLEPVIDQGMDEGQGTEILLPPSSAPVDPIGGGDVAPFDDGETDDGDTVDDDPDGHIPPTIVIDPHPFDPLMLDPDADGLFSHSDLCPENADDAWKLASITAHLTKDGEHCNTIFISDVSDKKYSFLQIRVNGALAHQGCIVRTGLFGPGKISDNEVLEHSQEYLASSGLHFTKDLNHVRDETLAANAALWDGAEVGVGPIKDAAGQVIGYERTLVGTLQADNDHDGRGDACDPMTLMPSPPQVIFP